MPVSPGIRRRREICHGSNFHNLFYNPGCFASFGAGHARCRFVARMGLGKCRAVHGRTSAPIPGHCEQRLWLEPTSLETISTRIMRKPRYWTRNVELSNIAVSFGLHWSPTMTRFAILATVLFSLPAYAVEDASSHWRLLHLGRLVFTTLNGDRNWNGYVFVNAAPCEDQPVISTNFQFFNVKDKEEAFSKLADQLDQTEKTAEQLEKQCKK
jgi:hypothetical protein